MVKRALHDALCEVLGTSPLDEDDRCYFSPPADKDITYPCIVYNYTNDDEEFADNVIYRSYRRYTITIIDEDSDSEIPIKLKNILPYCTSDRNFASDGLNHFVYTLFYNGPRIIKEEEDNG